MKKSSIMNHTSRLSATVSWAEIMDYVILNCNHSACLVLAADIPCTSIGTIDLASPASPLLIAGDVAASDSHYTFTLMVLLLI
ncbi:uncharacterized protein OCT59_026202 [Rhizophagus irregularis]|nr:hypothetical protein OCT59_026202 [Rhizophagus irregularis]